MSSIEPTDPPRRIGSTTALPVSVAIELLHALVQRVADDQGIRILFIKSLSARHHGLREHRASTDVDVLVNPARFGDLLAELGRHGWLTRPHDHDSDLFAIHAVTLLRPGWPADLDLHYTFPGLEAPSQVLFERLWDQHIFMETAGLTVTIPGWADAVVIEAANRLRTPWQPHATERLEFIAGAVMARPGGAELILRSSRELGALGSIAPFLETLGIPSPSGGWPRPSKEWVVASSTSSWAARRVLKIATARWRDKFVWIRDALWPSAAAIISQNIYLPPREISWQRLRRFRKAARELPDTFTGLLRLAFRLQTASDLRSELPAGALCLQPRPVRLDDLDGSPRAIIIPLPPRPPIRTAPTSRKGPVEYLLEPRSAWTTANDNLFVLPAGRHEAITISGLASTVMYEFIESEGHFTRESIHGRLIPDSPLPPEQARPLLDLALEILVSEQILQQRPDAH